MYNIHYISCTYLQQGYVWSNGRRGRYIKTNASGIKRRRQDLPRGSKMASQGRPVKRKQGSQHIPIKPKKPKVPHKLSVKVHATINM